MKSPKALLGLILLCGVAAAQSTVVKAPSPRDSGDDTASLQAAIDALPSGGILDGQNFSYNVLALRLKSSMEFRNFRLTAIASSTKFLSPVTLDGTRGVIRNVRIANVHINGNRTRQSNLLGMEDGGRSGFRLVGLVEDVEIRDSSATYCATDGLQLFSGDGMLSRDDNRLNIKRILVLNSRFEYNRRHGVSVDSISEVTLRNVTMNSNGLDISGGTEGAQGARHGDSELYGAGFSMEGYGVGSGVNGLLIENSTARANARFAVQFWEPTRANLAGFVPRRNIYIVNSTLEYGVSPRHTGYQAVEFFLPAASYVYRPVYENIVIQDSRINGTLLFGAVNGLQITRSVLTSPFIGFWGGSYASTNVVISNNTDYGKIFAQQ